MRIIKAKCNFSFEYLGGIVSIIMIAFVFFSLKLFFGGLKMFVLMWVAGFWGRNAFYFDDISVQFKYKNSYFKTVRLWLWWRCFVLLLFGCSEWRVLKSTHMSVYIVGMISMMSWWFFRFFRFWGFYVVVFLFFYISYKKTKYFLFLLYLVNVV